VAVARVRPGCREETMTARAGAYRRYGIVIIQIVSRTPHSACAISITIRSNRRSTGHDNGAKIRLCSLLPVDRLLVAEGVHRRGAHGSSIADTMTALGTTVLLLLRYVVVRSPLRQAKTVRHGFFQKVLSSTEKKNCAMLLDAFFLFFLRLVFRGGRSDDGTIFTRASIHFPAGRRARWSDAYFDFPGRFVNRKTRTLPKDLRNLTFSLLRSPIGKPSLFRRPGFFFFRGYSNLRVVCTHLLAFSRALWCKRVWGKATRVDFAYAEYLYSYDVLVFILSRMLWWDFIHFFFRSLFQYLAMPMDD